MKVNISDFPKDTSKREVSVEISDHDIWNLDHTLALIIHPALIKIKNAKHGAPFVDNEDVPDELKMSDEDMLSWHNGHDTDNTWFARYEYVLDEMIWAFDQIANDKEPMDAGEEYKQWNKRVDNGLRLFGKYYRGLWI